MLLRTPNARDGEPRGTQPPEKRLAGGHQPSLGDQIEHDLTCGHTVAEHALHPDLFPTPRAGDGDKGGPNQRGSSGDLMLPSAVTTLPTPTARDWKNVGDPDKTAGRMDDRGQPLGEVVVNSLLPTPNASDQKGSGATQGRSKDGRLRPLSDADLPEVAALLPTPAVNDMGAAYTPETWDAWTARMKAAHNNGNGHGNSLSIEAQRVAELLPTPSVADGTGGHETRSGERSHERLLPGVAKYDLLPTPKTEMHTKTSAHARAKYGSGDSMGDVVEANRWGKYAAAITRWEAVTRPAPEPTNITDGYLKTRAKRLAGQHAKPAGMRGSLKPRRQLAARFSEWMMGVPLDWICGVPGITRNEALKAAGNGVLPQQAAEGLRFLLAMPTGRQIAAAYEPVDLLEMAEALR